SEEHTSELQSLTNLVCRLLLEKKIASFKLAVSHGVKVATGSEGGGNVHQESGLMVEGGMTPIDAIAAATRRDAELLDTDHKVGTIDKGKWADLVVFDKDPLEDIANTTSVSTVISRGVPRPIATIKFFFVKFMAQRDPNTFPLPHAFPI